MTPKKGKEWTNPKRLRCPECNSTRLFLYGKRDVARKPVQQYKCRNCKRVTFRPKGG